MEFRVNPSLLRLWNISRRKPANVIGVVSRNESVTVRNSSVVAQERRFRSVSAFGCTNNSQCYPKTVLKNRLNMKFLMQLMTKKAEKEDLEESWGGPEALKVVRFLKDDIDTVLKNNEFVMVFYSATWCPHCRRMQRAYGSAALMAKKANLPMVFATFDVNYNQDIAIAKGVIGVPLIKYYKDGKFVANYKGKRTDKDLFEFAKNPPKDKKTSKKPDI